ncbi:MAG: hypothetical protein IJS44_02935 [Clostridia bacterium]|nr:hypothetical protein [Clostridia bacterium]
MIDSTTLTALGSAVRGTDGSAALLSPAQMAAKMQNYFVRTVYGDGTKVLSVSLPFYPDVLYVRAASPYSAAVRYGEIMMIYDLRSFLRYNGINRVAASNTWQAQVLANTAENRPTYENGVLTLTGAAISGHDFVFPAVAYTLVAVKTTDKTDRELLTEVVAGLPDSAYTATFSQYRVNATVTESEWAALTQTKPNVTFALT